MLDEKKFFPSQQVPLRASKDLRSVAFPGDVPIVGGRFRGFRRAGGRGVGTRNFVVIIGTTSRTATLARQAARLAQRSLLRLQRLQGDFGSIDGVTAVAHTEGGGGFGNNLPLLKRTLAGLATHPNVGAFVVLDYDDGTEALTGLELQRHMLEAARKSGGCAAKLSAMPHAFFTARTHSHRADVEAAAAAARALFTDAATAKRTLEPLSKLRVALQCGGSDAFSGISGNPLAGLAAELLIEHGGAAVQAETDELMGAESYFLSKCRDWETARRFLMLVARFKARLVAHGQNHEANPSAGNQWRGLYNIALKSLGAGMKKSPAVRLDGVVEYAEPLWPRAEGSENVGRTSEDEKERGFFFMDSPGNDLESIAGQVASGCNCIYFTTGNGAITNFPFVPTLKIVTTTGRFERLHDDMDVNAGRFQDGEALLPLAEELFDRTVRVASGERTKGEGAGHSQVSIWRDWAVPDDAANAQRSWVSVAETPKRPQARSGNGLEIGSPPTAATPGAFGSGLRGRRDPTHQPCLTRPTPQVVDRARSLSLFRARWPYQRGGCNRVGPTTSLLSPTALPYDAFAVDAVALVLPTSLCSSEVARLCAERLNAEIRAELATASDAGRDERPPRFSDYVHRFVALPHTEGCGSAGEDADRIYEDVLLGHLAHPVSRFVCLLEHGCEKQHNDAMRARLVSAGMKPSHFGWVSVQGNGGIERSIAAVRNWFYDACARESVTLTMARVSLEVLGLGRLGLGIATGLGTRSKTPRPAVAAALAEAVRSVVQAGGFVVVPSNCALMRSPEFLDGAFRAGECVQRRLRFGQSARLSLGRAQCAQATEKPVPPGIYVMHCQSTDLAEILTGLGATAVQVLAVLASARVPAHPMLPTLAVLTGSAGPDRRRVTRNADILLADCPEDAASGADSFLRVACNAASRRMIPRANAEGHTAFQVSRGLLGVSV
jgi:altronate dehydratase